VNVSSEVSERLDLRREELERRRTRDGQIRERAQ
jgi:hypothetical protein